MTVETKIAPSILSADFSNLGQEIKDVVKAGADWLHIDVMDGVFVPNITIGPCVVKSIRAATNIPFDVHLMIENPISHVEAFAKAGADIITFHAEACKVARQTIDKIKKLNKKVGMSIKPKTPVSVIEPYFSDLDLILVMTVEPGFAGQKFMLKALPKIKELKKKYSGDIEVDGGITEETAKKAIDAGANVLVAGTSVFGKSDYKKAIEQLKK